MYSVIAAYRGLALSATEATDSCSIGITATTYAAESSTETTDSFMVTITVYSNNVSLLVAESPDNFNSFVYHYFPAELSAFFNTFR
jgi:hypothetical protein